MIVPIHVFGSPSLRIEAEVVEEASQALVDLVDDMIETMHNASGIGLATPQIGRSERLFVIDLSPVLEKEDDPSGELEDAWRGPVAIINPEILAVSEELEEYEEGCLSIPDILENVTRPMAVRLRYQDQTLEPHEVEISGMLARVVQHELDHLNGILFTDRISPLRRRLLRRRLREISRGEVEADYELLIPAATHKA